MTKINIISPPDKLYNECYSILLLYPNKNIQTEMQALLSTVNDSVNVYLYNTFTSTSNTQSWLLDVIGLVDIIVFDIDLVPETSFVYDLISYIVAKPKTYWLTNRKHLTYNYISNNRIYDLSFLSNIGVFNDKKQ